MRAAGVDLLLVGHEHTYSWTYPLLDQAGGQPTFVADTDKSYAKGDGLIQVIAGTGGKSIGPGRYSSFPFVASGFTTATTPVAENGFAKLDVSPNQLTVSYIAADDGAIIDSFTIIDGPVVEVTYNAAIPEESVNGTAVATVDAADLGLSGTNLSYTISAGDPNGGFAIDAAGNISIADASVLDLEYDDGTDFVATLTVEVNDGANVDTVNVMVRFTPSSTLNTVTFQQGVSGYTSTRDTYLQGASPNANDSTASELNVDGRDFGQPVHGLLRFDDIFGSGPGQIPLNADIQSATLVLNITNTGHSVQLYRMLQPWSDTDSWNSFAAGGGGIQPAVEAAGNADATALAGTKGLVSIDVSTSLLQWLNNPASNFGWALLPTGTNGVDFDSSEGNTPPRLVVDYLASPPASAEIMVFAAGATGEETMQLQIQGTTVKSWHNVGGDIFTASSSSSSTARAQRSPPMTPAWPGPTELATAQAVCRGWKRTRQPTIRPSCRAAKWFCWAATALGITSTGL